VNSEEYMNKTRFDVYYHPARCCTDIKPYARFLSRCPMYKSNKMGLWMKGAIPAQITFSRDHFNSLDTFSLRFRFREAQSRRLLQ